MCFIEKHHGLSFLSFRLSSDFHCWKSCSVFMHRCRRNQHLVLGPFPISWVTLMLFVRALWDYFKSWFLNCDPERFGFQYEMFEKHIVVGWSVAKGNGPARGASYLCGGGRASERMLWLLQDKSLAHLLYSEPYCLCGWLLASGWNV